MPIPPAMGTAIAINFQPTGGTKAAITGDFVVTAEELNPMIRALRSTRHAVTLSSHASRCMLPVSYPSATLGPGPASSGGVRHPSAGVARVVGCNPLAGRGLLPPATRIGRTGKTQPV